MSMFYVFQWPNTMTATYNYGSQIQIRSTGQVHFENALMSPGKRICTWTSDAGMRYEIRPLLPLLSPGVPYYFNLDLTVRPANGVYVVIDFLSAAGLVIGSTHFSAFQGTFQLPETAVAYTMNLVNRNQTQLSFNKGYIVSAAQHERYTFTFAKQTDFVVAQPKNLRTFKSPQLWVVVNDATNQSYPLSNDELRCFFRKRRQEPLVHLVKRLTDFCASQNLRPDAVQLHFWGVVSSKFRQQFETLFLESQVK